MVLEILEIKAFNDILQFIIKLPMRLNKSRKLKPLAYIFNIKNSNALRGFKNIDHLNFKREFVNFEIFELLL